MGRSGSGARRGLIGWASSTGSGKKCRLRPSSIGSRSSTCVEVGADLSLPRHILHFLYFEDEQAARAAGEALSAGGYEFEVNPPDEQVAEWVVRAETTRVIDETTVPAYRRFFEQVASEHGGEYDGWEAATKP